MDSRKVLNGFHLKLIACAAMFIDHFSKVVLHGTALSVTLTRTVGRIAFPIFAFLLMEGFLHTKSRAKYARNLLLAAIISEIFFDKAIYGKWIYLPRQNTCFTLLLGLLLFICLEKCSEAEKPLLMLPAAAGFACVFYFAGVDYGLTAFAVFLAAYLVRFAQTWFVGLIMATILFSVLQAPGAYLCVIPLAFYNKTRGQAPGAVKVLFYAFYPAHLCALALVRAIGGF